MEKGLRREYVAMIAKAFKARSFYKQVVLHYPTLPFPAVEMLPALYIAVMPWDVQEETNNERQNDFRLSLSVVLGSMNPEDDLDLLKCDAADDVEECLIDLSRTNAYTSKFSQMKIARFDTTPLALVPYGIPQVQLLPPFGAVRADTINDFHYKAVAA